MASEAKVIPFLSVDELAEREFYRCPVAERVLVALIGDDKVWCHRCQKTHRPAELQPSSAQAMAAQHAQGVTG